MWSLQQIQSGTDHPAGTEGCYGSREHLAERAARLDRSCEACGADAVYHDSYCGARVCEECGDHQGLARCYCGWSISGRNGRTELRELGECLEPDEY